MAARADFDKWAEEHRGWDQKTGAPGIGLFSNAVQVWALMQPEQSVSVARAARVFNVDPQRICEAVQWHVWMFLAGPTDDYTKLMIEHDGE